MSKVTEILKGCKAIIADPANWAQGALARTADGKETNLDNADACAFCSYGALMKGAGVDNWNRYFGHAGTVPCDELDDQHAVKVSLDLLHRAFDGRAIGPANDSSTHEEVMAAWDKAIATAEARAASGKYER